jgi:hypothetical protein
VTHQLSSWSRLISETAQSRSISSLREEYPDGRYEAGADIAGNEWIAFKLDIDEDRLSIAVNGTQTLAVGETKAPPVIGSVGLWVDIGTEGYFSNLRITPR